LLNVKKATAQRLPTPVCEISGQFLSPAGKKVEEIKRSRVLGPAPSSECVDFTENNLVQLATI